MDLEPELSDFQMSSDESQISSTQMIIELLYFQLTASQNSLIYLKMASWKKLLTVINRINTVFSFQVQN